MENFNAAIQQMLIWVLPVLFAITVHEVAHGWVANKLGDSTALRAGRLTLNPIAHIDLIGTILVPLITFVYGGILFGWAKPVPVNWYNLRKPRRDAALVAAAGPGANLIMLIFWAMITKIGLMLWDPSTATPDAVSVGNAFAVFLKEMGQAGITINLILMLLNLIPIPPLDGSRVVSSLLSPRAAVSYNKIEPYGFIILIVLLFTNVIGIILMPPFYFLRSLVAFVFGL